MTPKQVGTANRKAFDALIAANEKKIAALYKDAYKETLAALAKMYASMDTPTLANAQKYGRLETLLSVYAEQYRKITGKAIELQKSASSRAYAESYYRGSWGYAAQGVDVRLPLINAAAIRASVYSKVSGYNFIKTFQRNASSNIDKVRGAVTRGLVQNESGYRQTAAAIKDMFNNGFNDALRVVRTESLRNEEMGHLASTAVAESLGLEIKKIWYTAKDSNVRDSHRELDGVEADKNGNWTIDGVSAPAPGLFGVPGEDINCRCEYIEEVIDAPEELKTDTTDESFSEFADMDRIESDAQKGILTNSEANLLTD